MPMYSRQTSVSSQPGGRPTTVFYGDISSTQQHSNSGTLLTKKTLVSVGISCRHVCLSVCLSVRLSQVGVLLKRLHVGSHEQRHTIAQGL